MKRILLPLVLLLAQIGFAQLSIDTLAIQDFELVPQSPVWTFTGPVIYNSGFSSGAAAPPNSPIGIGGSRAWETTSNSGGLILDFANVTIPSGYDSIRVHFNLAAMCLISSVGGPDDLDYVLVAYSTNAGASFVNRLRIRGAVANNSFWAYDALGVAKTYYTPTTEALFQPLTTGLQTTRGYSNCEIVFPGSVTQVQLRITGRSSSSTDTWLIDNVLITGESNCLPSTATIAPTACDSYTSPSGNQTWTMSGTYTDVLTNSVGCDSLVTVILTINASTNSVMSGTYCDSLLSPSGNHIWTQSGSFYDTLSNSAGCDSFILANIVVVHSSSSTVTVSDCDSYVAPSGAVYTSSGTYIDVIPNAEGCDSVITILLSLSTPNTAVTLSGNTLTATATAATYQWLDCNNSFSAISGATNQSFSPMATGNYAVMVTENGCSDTSACTQVTVVSAENALATAGVQVFPNPADQVLVLQLRVLEAASGYKVFDVSGKLQIQGTIEGLKTTIDLTSLEAGMYFLQVGSETRQQIRFTKL